MLTQYSLGMPQGAERVLYLLPVVLLVLSPLLWKEMKKKDRISRAIISVILAGVFMLVLYLSYFAPRLTKATIGDGFIEIRTPPAGNLRIERGEIKTAFIADWQEEASLQPIYRTFGSSIGSYKTGRFRLRSGDDALLMTNSSRVLVIQTGRVFALLAPDNFAAFIREFSERVTSVTSIPSDLPPVSAEPVRPPGMPGAVKAILILSGLLVFFLGWLVRFKKMLHLLSGYDERKVKDKDALARFAGNFVMLIGVSLAATVLFDARGIIIFSVALLPVSVWAIIKMNKL